MRRILIANRGEIACRIIRSCRRMGLEAVAVHSPADAGALHTTLADRAMPLPGTAPRDSYANGGLLIAAALESGADAIHPGYGFLAENAAFARAVVAAGLTWIGPDPATIAAMGDKNRARALARAAGLPVLPGSPPIGPQDAGSVAALAEGLVFPVIVKAAAGGGGIGMRRVDDPAALAATVATVQAHAARLYGDPTVYIETLVTRARHVEVQVFGFGDGEAIHLFERDCSVQRRFQKVVEESPAPGVDPARLALMHDAAVALARRQRYGGPGTVEFLYDDDSGAFYFLEMNTRIQVEHPVTEMVTGLDLIEAQIRLAAGDPLDALRAGPPPRAGHAIEVRLYAEDPRRNFLPSPGTIGVLTLPAPSPDLRVETGVRAGDAVTPHYDPMIAKIIGCGRNRVEARATLTAALAGVAVSGVRSNLALLRAILDHPCFAAGLTHTRFLDDHMTELLDG